MLLQYALENEVQLHEHKKEPHSVFFDAVVLLADISGFTRVAGNLCKGGKDGLDKLQKVTNDYLGELVNIIYSYKGDVMKFAGDALICVFQPSRYSRKGMTLSDVCSNAVQCAGELAQVSIDKLTIHVAISCGSICFAMLGGYNNVWENLISGECLGHLHQCLVDAGSQQTVVSLQFVEMLGIHYRKELNIEQLPSGNYIVLSAIEMNSLLVRKMIKQRRKMLRQDCEARFSMFPNDAPYLKGIECFVPIPVCEALSLGSFHYLAELREVTTMFMSLDSYDEKKHKDLLSLQKTFMAAQIILNESGGFIRQFLLDDKGCILIACWGVPTASHPDNARRALSAGANIGFELNKLDMKTSVGISTGNAFCGSVGSYVRREYTMIGDVVNLAARLMSKAKLTGDVFIDEATYSRLPFFMKRNLVLSEPILLKGQSKPIAAYVLHKDTQFSLNDEGFEELYLNKLVVRSICKEPLQSRMVDVSKDELVTLKTVLMEGNEFSGKADVLDWLRFSTEDMNIRLINLKMSPEHTMTEYSLTSRLFRSLIGEDMFDDPDCQEVVIRHMLRKIYRGDKETVNKVAFPAMWIALGINRNIQELKSQYFKNYNLPSSLLVQCLRDIFSYLFSEVPLVIVLDDIHFADIPSWNIVVNLLDITSKTLLVMTMEPMEELSWINANVHLEEHMEAASANLFTTTPRTSREPPTTGSLEKLQFNYRKLCKHSNTRVVIMNIYTIREISDLLCSVLGIERCPEELASMVHQFSGGIPFWIRKMALFIHSTGPEEFMTAMSPRRNKSNSLEFQKNKSNSLTLKKNSSFCTHDLRPQGHESKDSSISTHVFPIQTARGDSSFNIHGNRSQDNENTLYENEKSKTTGNLELFIVCRLEKLLKTDKSILRTASMLGRTFSENILFGILSGKLQNELENSIKSLIKNQWILEDQKTSLDGHRTYTFVHPLFYQTIYDLTPKSDRVRLHYAIASYIGGEYGDNPSYYPILGYHYGLSEDARPKALENFVKASVHCMSHGPLFYDKGLELLLQARIFIDTACDCEVVLLIIKYEKENLEEKNKLLENEIQSEREEKKNGVLSQPTSFSLPSSSGTGSQVAKKMFPRLSLGTPRNNKVRKIDNDDIVEEEKDDRLSVEFTKNSPKNSLKDSLNASLNIMSLRDDSKVNKVFRKVSETIASVSQKSKIMIKKIEEKSSKDIETLSKIEEKSLSRRFPLDSTRSPTEKSLVQKDKGSGLTIKGFQTFFKIFEKIEAEFHKMYVEKIDANNIGVLLEWQKEFMELNLKSRIWESSMKCPTIEDAPYFQRSDSILIVDGSGIKIMTKQKHKKRQKNVTNVLCLLGIPSLDSDEIESGHGSHCCSVKREFATMNTISETNTRNNYLPNIFENSARINKGLQNNTSVPVDDQLLNESIDSRNRRFVDEIDEEIESDPFMSNNNNIINSPPEKITPVESRAASVEIIVESRLKRNFNCVLC
mmetsp:Transcript_27908/g.26759  ORF Transcript_27908/g.26759 Transcript_27908/m.26759 type:complete len:1469 (+) Transcript_27908:102-4508(+)